MKKIIALLLVLSLALSLFAQGGAETKEVAGPETIVWAGWSGEEEASKAIFAKMRENYEATFNSPSGW